MAASEGVIMITQSITQSVYLTISTVMWKTIYDSVTLFSYAFLHLFILYFTCLNHQLSQFNAQLIYFQNTSGPKTLLSFILFSNILCASISFCFYLSFFFFYNHPLFSFPLSITTPLSLKSSCFCLFFLAGNSVSRIFRVNI